MALSFDKDSESIIVNGYEQGIQPSPHKGIANLQNVNISTESGEVVNSFSRTQNSMNGLPATAGTLSTASGAAPTVTVSYLIIGGGGGGGGAGANVGGGGGGGGRVTSGTSGALALGTYTITVGAAGTAGAIATDGGVGGTSSAFSVNAAGGLAGKGAAANTTGGAGGASASGNAGGTGFSSSGGSVNGGSGGGGGDSAIGTNGGSNTVGGNGGAGTSNSLSGAAVTYGGGGGGFGLTAGTGGTGGGGNGMVAGTANTGGGGGGASSGAAGKAGGSGIVVISVPTRTIVATGGAKVTIGGNDVYTFTSSGTFTIINIAAGTPSVFTLNIPGSNNLLKGLWITVSASSNTTTLPNGNYWVQQNTSNYLLSPYFQGYTVQGVLAGVTATINLVASLGRPIAQATESYYTSGTPYNKYYILDVNNLVWVWDTYNETAFSSSDNVGWYLPDYQTNWCTSASGIGIISGFLIAGTSTGAFAKSTALLGNNNSTATAWTQIPDITNWAGSATSTINPHFCYVGHQGNFYVTDGAYVANIEPISTISDSAGISSAQNVQSFCSWTAATQFSITPSIISGTTPIPSDAPKGVPVVFYTVGDGSLPTYILPNTVYYLSYTNSTYSVYPTSTVTPTTALTLSGSILAGATSATLNTNFTGVTGNYSTTFNNANLDVRSVLYTNGSSAISWSVGLTQNAGTAITVSNAVDVQTGANGTQYFNTFYPLSGNTKSTSTTPLYYFQNQRLSLPVFEIAQCMTEVGNLVVIGCKSNVLYPWDQIQNLPASIVTLPENNTVNILTVHNMAYVFAGNKGNIYLTDGNVASSVTTIPDYCAGVPGTPGSYIEPVFAWGGTMYLRGRVYFSVLDQTSSKAGNCGGVWSFTPTQALYIGQDVGMALRLENQSSYGTYNGVAPILIPKVGQSVIAPQYFSAWYSSISSPTYGIDTTGTGTNSSSVGVIETDLIPTGLLFDKKTFDKVIYKLSTALAANATAALSYRTDSTSAWTSCGTLNFDAQQLSGYYPVNFMQTEWIQLRAVLTPTTATPGTFIRLSDIRLRN